MLNGQEHLPTSAILTSSGQTSSATFRPLIVLAILGMSAITPARADLDLRAASVERLDNGLTLIMLTDRTFPVVSVQMLYRVGARNEVTGRTGLAHFLEHMAFRDSEKFPETGLVSSIYAVGGEWHGYTWTDQTTYYSTVPREHVDLLLRIEADRMARLEIDEQDMPAERGAVLAEMHMYENSPTSMLIDAVNYTTFLAHPYRNNTIGWESDIQNLQHDDVVDFYEQHYVPANAVLAIVGDFERDEIRARVIDLFGSFQEKEPTPLPHTIEPPQEGVRRVTLHGPAKQRQFMIAYRAPSVASADYAAFLVLQEILGTSSGVSFLQNDWGTPIDDAALLAGAAESLTTWFPPSAQDYVFIIGGTAGMNEDETVIEQRIESRVESLRREAPAESTLQAAIDDVQDALVFDVQTTEDAAHQLAFFTGLDALDTLLALPARVGAVTAADVQRVARRYLGPGQRSIAWYLPGNRAKPAEATPSPTPRAADVYRAPVPTSSAPVDVPVTTELSGGIPVIVQRSAFSSTAQLQLVMPSNRLEGAAADTPIPGYSSLTFHVRSQRIDEAVRQADEALAALERRQGKPGPGSGDPWTRLEQEFASLMQTSVESEAPRPVPSLITIVGDVDADEVIGLLENTFGGLRPGTVVIEDAEAFSDETAIVSTDTPVAQAQLGYIAAAPGPGEPRAEAWRLLLYILSHDYEGRLGKEAISESGLVYYIGSEYRSDGRNGWITLSAGVDTEKISPLKKLLHAELQRMDSEPPTEAELAEAKHFRMGRLQSAAQSNAELGRQLATQWLWYGKLLTVESLRERLEAVSRADLLDEIAAFRAGKTVIVTE